MIKESPFKYMIGVDLETSNTNSWSGGILEIGAIVMDKKGNELDFFLAHCNPGDVEYSEEALKINNLTREFINKQRPVADVLREFVNWLYKYTNNWNKSQRAVIIGNNFSFDMGFFNYSFNKHIPDMAKETKWLYHKYDDLKHVSRVVMPDKMHMSQENLGKELGIYNENAHSALGDVRQMLQLYIALMKINSARISDAYTYNLQKSLVSLDKYSLNGNSLTQSESHE